MLSLEDFNKLDADKEIMAALEKLLPEWLVETAPRYAKEYDELNISWDKVCKKIGTEKRKLLIVKYLPIKADSDSDKYINNIADILVGHGYLLRRTVEVVLCPKTGYALVSKKMFEYFKKYNNIFPEKWSSESTEDPPPKTPSPPSTPTSSDKLRVSEDSEDPDRESNDSAEDVD